LRRVPAIHEVAAAGDEGGGIGGEEADERRDFSGGVEAAEGVSAGEEYLGGVVQVRVDEGSPTVPSMEAMVMMDPGSAPRAPLLHGPTRAGAVHRKCWSGWVCRCGLSVVGGTILV
jgi:hypothetical protein